MLLFIVLSYLIQSSWTASYFLMDFFLMAPLSLTELAKSTVFLCYMLRKSERICLNDMSIQTESRPNGRIKYFKYMVISCGEMF
jgi:hypothetical protein